MQFIIPNDWIVPDEQTGALPEIIVGDTNNTWVEVKDYWNSLGYFMRKGSNNTVELYYPLPRGIIEEKNAFMQVAWWEALCDTSINPTGNVIGWQAVWQIHPTVYDQGLVPLLIPNSTYVNDLEETVQRLWKQWGSQNHEHYYLPTESEPQDGLTPDRYLIPTWSWGSDIAGIEMMYGQNEQGINIVSREDFQAANNQGALTVVPITPVN